MDGRGRDGNGANSLIPRMRNPANATGPDGIVPRFLVRVVHAVYDGDFTFTQQQPLNSRPLPYSDQSQSWLLPNSVATADTINSCKSHLDKFWSSYDYRLSLLLPGVQEIKFSYDRSYLRLLLSV